MEKKKQAVKRRERDGAEHANMPKLAETTNRKYAFPALEKKKNTDKIKTFQAVGIAGKIWRNQGSGESGEKGNAVETQ